MSYIVWLFSYSRIYYILYIVDYILYVCVIYCTHTHTHTHTHMHLLHIYITGVLYALWNVAVCVQRGGGQTLVASGDALEVIYISVYIHICIYTYVLIYIYVYTYIHTYILLRQAPRLRCYTLMYK